jgi:hypothetical protein
MSVPAALLAALLFAVAPAADASFFKGEALDTAANILALFVLFAVPIGVVALFWMVHVLPEKIAEKRHHPQKSAIKTLCMLSLVFGGLLWPLAWLWAYMKPVGYKLAYGTDKHSDWFVEAGERAQAGTISAGELAEVRSELDALAARGFLTAELHAVREQIAARQRAAQPGEAS